MPLAIPLALSRMSGWTPQCSTAHIVPGPTGARLDLVGDEQDPVPVAELAEALEEAVLGDDVAALALDRLDDDRRDLAAGASLSNRTSSNQRRSSTRPYGAWKTPGRSGPNPAWYLAFDAVRLTEP